MDISEKEAAQNLNDLGLKSAWGCQGGVFIDSADAFQIIKLLNKYVPSSEILKLLEPNDPAIARMDEIMAKLHEHHEEDGRGAYGDVEQK